MSHILTPVTCSNGNNFLSLEGRNFTWSSNMIVSAMTQPVIITLSPESKRLILHRFIILLRILVLHTQDDQQRAIISTVHLVYIIR